MNDQKSGTLFILGAATLWGLQGILSKYIYQSDINPLNLAVYKVGISFLVLLVGLVIFKPQHLKVQKKHMFFLVLYGLTGVGLFNISLLTAVYYSTVSTAVTLMYTAPAFVSVLSALFLGETFTKTKLFALISTLLGCYLVVGGHKIDWTSLNLPGIIAGLSAGFTYALYSVIGKKNVQQLHHWTVIFYGLGFGTLLLLVIARPTAIGHYSGLTWLNIIILSLGTTLLAFLFYVKGLSLLEASKASIISSLEPVIAVISAAIVLNEAISFSKFFGFVLVMLAVFLLTRPAKILDTENKHQKTETQGLR